MKTYDRVKEVLLKDPQSRNSDKRLMWMVWRDQGLHIDNSLETWMKRSAHAKSIIEARRNMQRNQEEKLRKGDFIPESQIVIADKKYRKLREELNLQRGTHIFREDDGQGIIF
jgi:dephospho-CoA kinase